MRDHGGAQYHARVAGNQEPGGRIRQDWRDGFRITGKDRCRNAGTAADVYVVIEFGVACGVRVVLRIP